MNIISHNGLPVDLHTMKSKSKHSKIEIIIEKELDDEGTNVPRGREMARHCGETGPAWYERPLSLRHNGNMVGGEVESDRDFLRILRVKSFLLVDSCKSKNA